VALVNRLTDRSIAHPGEILHVVGTLISLGESGDKVVADIETFFLTYIDELRDGGTLKPEMDVFDIFHHTGWASHGYQNYEHPTFKKVYAHLQTAVALAHKQDMAVTAKRLVQRLGTPGSEDALYGHCHGNRVWPSNRRGARLAR
jgi:hypothetical protein